jgi:hypothetical protein
MLTFISRYFSAASAGWQPSWRTIGRRWQSGSRADRSLVGGALQPIIPAARVASIRGEHLILEGLSVAGVSALGRMTGKGPGCAKTRAFNLLVKSSSQFGQSENQKCWRRLPEEGNRETGSTLSWLAHVFPRARANLAARSRSCERPESGAQILFDNAGLRHQTSQPYDIRGLLDHYARVGDHDFGALPCNWGTG